MKISLLLTPRLVVILSACAITIVLLLVMLGFELGLRQAHEDYLAQAKARGEPVYGTGVANTNKRVDSSISASGSTTNSGADAAGSSDSRRGMP